LEIPNIYKCLQTTCWKISCEKLEASAAGASRSLQFWQIGIESMQRADKIAILRRLTVACMRRRGREKASGADARSGLVPDKRELVKRRQAEAMRHFENDLLRGVAAIDGWIDARHAIAGKRHDQARIAVIHDIELRGGEFSAIDTEDREGVPVEFAEQV
jgi:hypothetical protein